MRPRLAVLVMLAASTVLSSSMLGCKQPTACPALEACGGERDPATGRVLAPVGEWVLAPGHPSCAEDLYLPPVDPRLAGGDLPAARAPMPEEALFDWCLLLVTGPGAGNDIQVRPPRFFFESNLIGVAHVRYEESGLFSTFVETTGTFTLDFPAYCVRAFGAMNGPAVDPIAPSGPIDPTAPHVDVCKRLEAPLVLDGFGEGISANTTCVLNENDPEGEEGCLCTFDLRGYGGGPSGSFELLDDHTIRHISERNVPQKATFCARGDRLQLTGTDGSYLFDQRGLRTFDLVRSCLSDTKCRSRRCVGSKTCQPCTEDGQCASGACDAGTGICASCVVTGQCTSGTCAPASGTCTACLDDTQCPADGSCDLFTGTCL